MEQLSFTRRSALATWRSGNPLALPLITTTEYIFVRSETRATPRRSKRSSSVPQVLHASREPVELRDDDRLHIAGVNQSEQPCHAGTVQALGRLTAIDDDVDQPRCGPPPWPNRFSLSLEAEILVALNRQIIAAFCGIAGPYHFRNFRSSQAAGSELGLTNRISPSSCAKSSS
jgi:hypothetical protein